MRDTRVGYAWSCAVAHGGEREVQGPGRVGQVVCGIGGARESAGELDEW